jgi:hypothetical protein
MQVTASCLESGSVKAMNYVKLWAIRRVGPAPAPVPARPVLVLVLVCAHGSRTVEADHHTFPTLPPGSSAESLAITRTATLNG